MYSFVLLDSWSDWTNELSFMSGYGDPNKTQR